MAAREAYYDLHCGYKLAGYTRAAHLDIMLLD